MNNFEKIPSLGSVALTDIYRLVEEIQADEVIAAVPEKHGCKSARTRVRTKLAKVANLCKQARKEIPPVR